MFSLLHIAWGLDWHLQETFSKLFFPQSRTLAIKTVSKLWNRIHGGGIIVEFLKSFYISSQMLDKGYVYPQKFPGVIYRAATLTFGSFFRLVPETLSRSLRQTTEKHHVFWFRQLFDQQMAFWHHRDSGRRSRTKLHQKHLFRDSEHTYNRCFWHVFRSMGFLQLEDRNSRTEHYQIQSRSLEIFRRFKGIRIGNSLNRDYTFSFSMKLSPQQLVYDQDANRSRRFNTNVGGLLEFHC
jgi:hypothetical protein